MRMRMIRSLRLQRKSLQLLLKTSGHRYVSSSTLSPPSSLSSSLNDVTNNQHRQSQHHFHDILICGGGVVGSFLAADILHQSKGQCSVGIIDNTTPSKEISSSSSTSTSTEPPFIRVYALSPLSVNYLKELGAWQYIEPRSQPYRYMQIWEETGPGFVRISSDETSADCLGYICEDKTIQAAIYRSITDRNYPLSTYFNSKIVDIQIPSDDKLTKYSLLTEAVTTITTTQSNDSIYDEIIQIKSRLLVGADGGNSIVRKLTGIPTYGWEYGQNAIAATVKVAPDSSSGSSSSSSMCTTAWQKYLSTGPLAVLPLWDNYASIVWSTTIPESKRLKALSNELFIEELNQSLSLYQSSSQSSSQPSSQSSSSSIFPPFIDRFYQMTNNELSSLKNLLIFAANQQDPIKQPSKIEAVVGEKVSFPLSFSQARSYIKNRCVLIGDAAHSIHPQAGQGLNLGLLDAKSLSSSVIKSLETGVDIGDTQSTLRQYENDRYIKNLGMMSLVDAIDKLFKPADDTIYAASPIISKLQRRISVVKSFGMLGVHSLQPIKQKIAEFAMGSSKH